MANYKKTFVRVPPVKPDRCWDCPFLGKVPPAKLRKGSKKTFVCMARMKALTGRGVMIRASKRDAAHPLNRPCDMYWAAYSASPKGRVQVNSLMYVECRVPFEQSLQYEIDFDDDD